MAMSMKYGDRGFYKRENWRIVDVTASDDAVTAFGSGVGYTETTLDGRRMWTVDGVYHYEIVRKDGAPNRAYGMH